MPNWWDAVNGPKFKVANLTRLFNMPSRDDMRCFWRYAAEEYPEPAVVYAEAIDEFLTKVGDKYVDKRDPDGNTALMLAQKAGNAAATKILIKHGALPLGTTEHPQSSEEGKQNLGHNVETGNLALVAKALEKGASPDTKFEEYYLITIATKQKHAAMVKLLAAAGADVNTGINNHTPLIEATRNADVKTVKVLLEAQADLDATIVRSYKGPRETALDIAKEMKNQELIDILENAGKNRSIGPRAHTDNHLYSTASA